MQLQLGFDDWPCPLCSGTSAHELFTVSSQWDLGPRSYSILRCRGCSLHRCSPAPSEKLLADYYREFDNQETIATHADWVEADFARTLEILEDLAPQKGTLVDIGCGSGEFLSKALDRGWSAMGIDPSQRAVERARKERGVHAEVGTATDFGLANRFFDVVHASHVLEHVRDPVGFTKSLVRRLRPGGLLVLLTPNAGSWLARLRQQDFNYWTPPTHLTGFTARAAERLLATAGLTPLRSASRGTAFDTFLFLRNRTPMSTRTCRRIAELLDSSLSFLAPLSGSILEIWGTTPSSSTSGGGR